MDMHDLAKYQPPPSMKGDSYEAYNWKVHNQELTVSDICVAIKYGPPHLFRMSWGIIKRTIVP